jgi:hypothetical protein
VLDQDPGDAQAGLWISISPYHVRESHCHDRSRLGTLRPTATDRLTLSYTKPVIDSTDYATHAVNTSNTRVACPVLKSLKLEAFRITRIPPQYPIILVLLSIALIDICSSNIRPSFTGFTNHLTNCIKKTSVIGKPS